MQRVCPVGGGVNSYLENPDCLAAGENLLCPLCKDHHRLRLHGWYERQALFPDPENPRQIPVRRLFCAQTGRTVSLLPDFCLPRRQHGPAILGYFLHALLQGLGLLAALRKVRRDAPGHSVAKSLLDGFLHRSVKIRAYLAALRLRVVEPAADLSKSRRPLAELVCGLIQDPPDPPAAFTFHGLRFHERFQMGLA